ncbi:DUF2064 domain-containing protein [uncultured Jatrophihabitans sp.]|uniref:TIGR04282 family arsenosugar biosynthesis glycosyltransferase n=1 Tax=uncultured Jatrophihabitans sp. TaxID=1610747 RepID=UPI0035CA1774
MTTAFGTVLVIAKEPVPGRVKTRLVPPLTHHQAATLAGAALHDTLAAADAVRARKHVLAFDGDVSGWLPHGWTHVDQPEGGLDERLGAAFDAAHAGVPAVLVGMDTPQLRPVHLDAFDPVRYDACLGMATDGGFWTIGFRDPSVARSVISGVPMSTSDTGAEQLRRMQSAGLDVQLLGVLTDVDTVADADAVAAAAPDTRFAAVLTGMRRAA